MTELDKMTAGVLYNCDAPEYQASWRHAALASAKFNQTSPLEDRETAVKAMKELMPNASEQALVIPPFYCDHGWPIHLAERVFINRNCEFLDSGGIYIGKTRLSSRKTECNVCQRNLISLSDGAPRLTSLVVIRHDVAIGVILQSLVKRGLGLHRVGHIADMNKAR